MAERRPVTVWVDHLGLAAFARLLALAARRRIERVRYLTVSPALGPLVRGVARFEGLDAFEYASHRAGRMNVYEAVHISAWELLDGLKRDLGVNPLLRDAVERYGLNAEKLRHHLLSLCFLQALRVIELVTISRAAGAADANVFLVRRSAALPALKSRFADAEIVSYLAPFARLGFRPRERNALDVYAAGGYFAGAALSFLGMAKFVLNWGLRAVFARGVPTPGPGGEDSANVAVHFCQTSHGRDDLTDLYWWFDSGIDPSAVTAFVSDPENEALIAALERDGFRVLVRPTRARVPLRRADAFALPLAGVMRGLARAARLVLRWAARSPRDGWLALGIADFLLRHAAYTALYRRLGVKLLFQLHDVDSEKTIKSQAVETLGGLSVAGHSSIDPVGNVRIDKADDVLVTWGEHPKDDTFAFFPYRDVFVAGFPYDYTFAHLRLAAERLGARFEGRFRLAYLDQNDQLDISTPPSAHRAIWAVFLRLMDRHPRLVILWKTKKPADASLARLRLQLPEIEQRIAEGRVEILERDDQERRRRPAEAGMAADLAVGLGLSSAAAECAFAGTPALHFEPAGLVTNGFANAAVGTAVYRDPGALEAAIESVIEGRGLPRAAAAKAAHARLDPFQDGRAYVRTGIVMAALQTALARGASVPDAIREARSRLDEALPEAREAYA